METGGMPVESDVTEDHGYILLRLAPAADAPEDWYAGSIAFSVNVQYDACLQQFYDEHPSWKGREDNGAMIFDAWQDTLCALDVPDRVGCEIETIAQEFSAISQLLVRYTPNDVDQLTNAVVPVGPFPTETMAGCVPVLRLEAGAVVGTQDIGEKVWEAMSFSSETAVSGQSEIIDAQVTVFHE